MLFYKGITLYCRPRFKFPPGWHMTQSKNHLHLSNGTNYSCIYLWCYNSLCFCYRESNEQAALVIMDNFNGQVISLIASLLEDNNILVCCILPKTIDKLQPMDLTVNKPAKDFLKQKFWEWSSDQILQQLDLSNTTNKELQLINLSLPVYRSWGLNRWWRW